LRGKEADVNSVITKNGGGAEVRANYSCRLEAIKRLKEGRDPVRWDHSGETAMLGSPNAHLTVRNHNRGSRELLS